MPAHPEFHPNRKFSAGGTTYESPGRSPGSAIKTLLSPGGTAQLTVKIPSGTDSQCGFGALMLEKNVYWTCPWVPSLRDSCSNPSHPGLCPGLSHFMPPAFGNGIPAQNPNPQVESRLGPLFFCGRPRPPVAKRRDDLLIGGRREYLHRRTANLNCADHRPNQQRKSDHDVLPRSQRPLP